MTTTQGQRLVRRRCEDCGVVTRARSGVCRRCQKRRKCIERWGSLSLAAKAFIRQLKMHAEQPDLFSKLAGVDGEPLPNENPHPNGIYMGLPQPPARPRRKPRSQKRS